ncbi:hypothetical protein UA08_09130 [Talaromyces atroroseus]|uniref:Uncharacterized protein n=1 Tax=Talaromyces atroroseus TaxID=1441469 RepID=A0A1Q5Q6X5_TALAT|nr:hypothetical protein UA08_09130 [Talaromyces atroroseus]OKL55594.1 hypothetical protein UA08_09130 [Talaromyces atroroseus]
MYGTPMPDTFILLDTLEYNTIRVPTQFVNMKTNRPLPTVHTAPTGFFTEQIVTSNWLSDLECQQRSPCYSRFSMITNFDFFLVTGMDSTTMQVAMTDIESIHTNHHFYNAPILEVDRQIKRLLGQADPEDNDVDIPDKTDWELPTPTYVFPERERLVENFYGPDAENYEEDKFLARRIQVTKDMVALSTLCEPSRRGNRVNWKFDDDESAEPEKPCFLEEETLDCPTDVCIICYGLSRRSASNPPPHRFPPKRQDSLRRHLIDCHLAKAYDGISCTWKMCHDAPKFTKITDFLAHAIYVHAYDVNIQLKHLPPWQLASGREDSSFDDSDSSSGSDLHSGIDTPASSITSEMPHIHSRLIESGSVHSTQWSPIT